MGPNPIETMYGSMAEDAKHRIPLHPNVDDAFAAFAKAGVPVKDLQQSLSRTYKAAYCSHGVTPSGELAVLVCEYRDEAGAAAGLEASKAVFPALTRRESWGHKQLMLAVMFQDQQGSPAATQARSKIVETFKGL